MTHTTEDGKRMYAIAVRDCEDLKLFLSVCRAPQGDVYVNFPRDHEPKWRPHSSYHASGQHHQKSFGRMDVVRQKQKPDGGFQGNENIVTTGIASDEPSAMQSCCVAEFEDVLEIPTDKLGAEHYSTMVSIDLSEPGGSPIITSGAQILWHKVIQDKMPWIHVTLFKN